MEKVFLKVPSNRIDKIILCISLSAAISGREISREEVLKILKDEGIEIDRELKNKFKENFPELDL